MQMAKAQSWGRKNTGIDHRSMRGSAKGYPSCMMPAGVRYSRVLLTQGGGKLSLVRYAVKSHSKIRMSHHRVGGAKWRPVILGTP